MVKVSGEVTLGLFLVTMDRDVGVIKLNNKVKSKDSK